MRLKAKRSARGSNHRSRARRGVLSLALAATALIALAFAASAQAAGVEYTTGTPLTIGQRTTSVAVGQSSGDVYVSSAGATVLGSSTEGSLKRFNSAGAEQSCALSTAPPYPAGLAVDPTSGDLAVSTIGNSPAVGEVLTFAEGCGAEVATVTGTADVSEGSPELTNVSTDHPLQVGQGVSGPGIPTATATANTTSGSVEIEVTGGAAGTFAVGQTVIGANISAGTTIVSCFPECGGAGPVEIELSAAPTQTKTGIRITARTTATTVAGSTVTLSNPAEAGGTGVAISGMAWKLETGNGSLGTLIGQPSIDGSGDIAWPDSVNDKLLKLAPWGEGLTEGSFPVESGVNDALSVAHDAQDNVFVTNTGTETGGKCAATKVYRLMKLHADGSKFSAGEGGVTGTESVFAGLTEFATSVAVDKSTGNVYVGIGCQAQSGTEVKHPFEVEVYGPGGNQLSSGIGAGLFSNSAFSVGALNELAFNEETKTLYAADSGHQNVQVFEDTSAQKTLGTSVSAGTAGEVECNMTGNACLSEYDEGQEVIAEAPAAEEGYEFKEWAGTGSASSCTGSSETSCTFTLAANSTIEAVYQAEGPAGPALTLKINEGVNDRRKM